MRSSVLQFTAILALATMSVPLSAADFKSTAGTVPARSSHEFFAYFGTGRGGPNSGFALANFDSATGKLTVPTVLPVTTGAPSIFILTPDGRHLYTCYPSPTFQGQPGGGVGAFSVDPATGALTELNSAPSGGTAPGFLSLDRTGRVLLVANYSGGSIAAYALKPDGSLGERTYFEQHEGKGTHPSRQNKPYCEVIFTDSTNRYVLNTDLGLDKIFIYRFDAKTGALTPNEMPFATIAPGSGPRHATFGRGEKFLYVIGEMSNTITTYAWDGGKGALTEVQMVSTLPDDFKANNNAAEILVHASGKFLYASNRGHDSLAVFAIDEKSGRLTFVQHVPTGGKTPRCFSFDPTGKWILVSNQGTNNVAVFQVDAATGKLTAHGEPVAVPSPLQAQFLAQPAKK
jgi:6-phosphogluconolactonase